MQRPVFIFSAGWRGGSTLLQRLCCSHPEILIWGENRGIVDQFQKARDTICGLAQLGNEHIEAFSAKREMAWIAVMNPPLEDYLCATRALLERYYRQPSERFGKSRWGFKEVRHGAETARFLLELYPEARFMLLLRDPVDCLASARAPIRGEPSEGSILAEAGGPRGFLENWARLARDFLDNWDGIRHRVLYYEKMIADPDQAIDEIAHFLDTEPGAFDRDVFKVKQRGWHHPPRLTHEDRRWLRADWLWRIAGEHGYQPRPDINLRSKARGMLDRLVLTFNDRQPAFAERPAR